MTDVFALAVHLHGTHWVTLAGCLPCPPGHMDAAPSALGRVEPLCCGMVEPPKHCKPYSVPITRALHSVSASFVLLFKLTPLFQKTLIPWLLLNPTDGHLPPQQHQFRHIHSVSGAPSCMLFTLNFLSYQAILPRVVHKSNHTHSVLLAGNRRREGKCRWGTRSFKMTIFLLPHYHSPSLVLSGHCIILRELFS